MTAGVHCGTWWRSRVAAGGLWKPRLSAFTQALADLGWTDGRNVRMDLRWGVDDSNRIRALGRELVGLQPDIIVTSSDVATVAVQGETRTIPIVFTGVADPVAIGIVARLDRPSGNVTGFAGSEASLAGKWVELLSEIAPGLKRAAIMFNPDTTSDGGGPRSPIGRRGMSEWFRWWSIGRVWRPWTPRCRGGNGPATANSGPYVQVAWSRGHRGRGGYNLKL
jgi:hypothetical protein